MTSVLAYTAEQQAADRENLRQALMTHAVRRGHVVLASGKESNYYVNAKEISLHGERLVWATRLMWERIAAAGCDAVGGLTLGADPLIGALCFYSGLAGNPLAGLIVRKQPKDHGTLRQIEGPIQPGMRVAVVEDVTTTGGSAIKAAQAIEEAGGIIALVLTILNRREGADEAFAQLGWQFESLFVHTDLGV